MGKVLDNEPGAVNNGKRKTPKKNPLGQAKGIKGNTS